MCVKLINNEKFYLVRQTSMEEKHKLSVMKFSFASPLWDLNPQQSDYSFNHWHINGSE